MFFFFRFVWKNCILCAGWAGFFKLICEQMEPRSFHAQTLFILCYFGLSVYSGRAYVSSCRFMQFYVDQRKSVMRLITINITRIWHSHQRNRQSVCYSIQITTHIRRLICVIRSVWLCCWAFRLSLLDR